MTKVVLLLTSWAKAAVMYAVSLIVLFIVMKLAIGSALPTADLLAVTWLFLLPHTILCALIGTFLPRLFKNIYVSAGIAVLVAVVSVSLMLVGVAMMGGLPVAGFVWEGLFLFIPGVVGDIRITIVQTTFVLLEFVTTYIALRHISEPLRTIPQNA